MFLNYAQCLNVKWIYFDQDKNLAIRFILDFPVLLQFNLSLLANQLVVNLAKLKILSYKIRWLLWDKSTSLFDYLLYQITPTQKNKTDSNDKAKHVVFVGEFLPPRIPRMAKWLKREGNFYFVLLCHQRGFVQKYTDPSFDETLLFRNNWHLKRLLKGIKQIDLVHGFAPKSYYCNVARKSVDAPYIHDMQDVYATYYGLNPDLNWLKKELPHERECLEKADGVVAHCLEANVAFRKYGIKKKPKTLFFPLYCDDDFFQEHTKKFNPDEIHLVYAGGVAGSHRNPKQYGNIQFQKLITTLSEQKIHFHIYPSPSNIRADYEEYEQIAKQNSYFHFHEAVAQQDLAKELGKYDFGIHTGFVNDELHTQSAEKYKYCTTLKLFNFMEAGIPTIISDNLIYQAWILERFGGGVTIERKDLEELDKLLISFNYSIKKTNLVNKRIGLSLKQNTQRLMVFYQKLITEYRKQHE